MFGRVVYALVAGLALGIILAAGLIYVLTRDTRAASTPAPGDLNQPFEVELTLTEAFLAAEIENPSRDVTSERDGRRLRDTAVRMRPDGTIQVSGKVNLYGADVPVHVVVLPRIANGLLEMRLIESQAGGFAVPAGIVGQIEDAVNARAGAAMAQKSFRVVALQPGEGTLTLRLTSDE